MGCLKVISTILGISCASLASILSTTMIFHSNQPWTIVGVILQQPQTLQNKHGDFEYLYFIFFTSN